MSSIESRQLHFADGLRLGYVLKRFPRLSETFILNEILELERQGVDVAVFSLRRPPEEPRHDVINGLRATVTYLSGGLAASWSAEILRPGASTEQHSLAKLIHQRAKPFADLMPGKRQEERLRLSLKSLSLGLLTQAMGLHHLHAHFGSDAATAALLASRLTGVAFSYTAHARDIYHTYTNAEVDARMRRQKIAEAQFVATVSDYNRRHLVELAGSGAASKIHRVYNGVDLARFHPDATVAREQDLILSVGRLIEKKGFADLIAACALLKDRGVAFRCLIVGDGPLRERLQQMINGFGLAERVQLERAMPQEAVIYLMRRATMFVLPCVVSGSGDRDGLPTVLLEALAIGLPCISTTVTGIPEIIRDGEWGILVEAGAPGPLAAAMARLLSDPALRHRFAAEGRRKAERDFNISLNIENLKRLFFAAAGVALKACERAEHADRVHIN